MSYTEIYAFGKDGNGEKYGEVKNAFSGAFAVWDIMGRKHIGAGASLCSMKQMERIWALFYDERVPFDERIVMGTTFDNCLVKRENIPQVVEAFKKFEGDTSLAEQAVILEEIYDSGKYIAVGWNQTSVNCAEWSDYNIFENNEHWYLFEESKE